MILNLLDCLTTVVGISLGAVEMNPVMLSIPVQIFFKVFVVGALCWWLTYRPERIARIGLWICTAFYGAVNLWHIVNIATIVAA